MQWDFPIQFSVQGIKLLDRLMKEGGQSTVGRILGWQMHGDLDQTLILKCV